MNFRTFGVNQRSMDPKTIVTAAILATMGVENSLKHEEG